MGEYPQSTITLHVDPLDTSTVYRPFGYHPVASIATLYIALLLSSSVATMSGLSSWIVSGINMLILVAPACLAVYCYSKQMSVLRTNKKWQDAFRAGLRFNIGNGARLTNEAEFMIAMRSGEPLYADIHHNGKYKTYDVAISGSEVVLFSTADIDHEWALMNAEMGY